jgi:uncharacterized membrane protein YccC
MQCAAPVVAARHLDSVDSHSLYVLLISLLGTVISLPVVCTSPKPLMLLLVSLRNGLRLSNDGSCSNQHR